MRRLVGLVRSRYRPTDEPLAVKIEPIESSELSFYFERLLRDERALGAGMQPVASQADTSLGALEANAWRRLIFGIVDKRLLESLHLSDGRELHVIDRGQTYAYRWQSIYGRRETWIPLSQHHRVRLGVGLRQGGHRPGDAHGRHPCRRTALGLHAQQCQPRQLPQVPGRREHGYSSLMSRLP